MISEYHFRCRSSIYTPFTATVGSPSAQPSPNLLWRTFVLMPVTSHYLIRSKRIRFPSTTLYLATSQNCEFRQVSSPKGIDHLIHHYRTAMLSRLGGKAIQPWRVLVAGGSYAGLAAALNLLDLCEGRLPRFNPGLERSPSLKYRVPIEVIIVDERDGYCKLYAYSGSRHRLTRHKII